ncbi:MAG: lipopolysaccharide transport system ATP-binding protein [Polaribacter sp.]|jgi:lipopolysaccharide transport system ATP-binding protein|uniref:ABC transporter ATP-binding protein n=1 Tax=Candidatus Marifrigoribacter sp. Uisw_064 TaxID=3230970 RepID=UPI003AD9CCA1
MKETILKIENISKQYRLGLVGTGTLSHDLNRFWYRIRGKEDPYLKVGAVNKRSAKAKEDYVWALQDINFEVEKGEVLGIIGKNGAGKSTLLKILSRVTSPTTGSIKTKGRIASLLEVGTGFHPELTGKENIYLNGAILGMTKAEISVKIDEIIEFSGCEMYIDTPVKRYSSGMRVRLAFAVAAHLEPDILVIDEVLAVGDAEFQKKAIGKMQDISKGEGRTVLFVSHNMESVQQLCTRCIVLSNGSICFNGTVVEGITYYLEKSNSVQIVNNFPIKARKITIKNFIITDGFDNEVNNMVIGLNYKFNIELLNIDSNKLINLRYQFFDRKENLITTINTFMKNGQFNLEANSKINFQCQIDKIQIAPGNYRIGIEIINLLNKDLLYENTDFYNVEINNGDYYQSGKIPSKENIGKILLDYNWEEI